jgi:hypothetical protein
MSCYYRSKMPATVAQVQSSRGSLISSVLPEKTAYLQTTQPQFTQEPLIAVLAETGKTSMMNDIQLAAELEYEEEQDKNENELGRMDLIAELEATASASEFEEQGSTWMDVLELIIDPIRPQIRSSGLNCYFCSQDLLLAAPRMVAARRTFANQTDQTPQAPPEFCRRSTKIVLQRYASSYFPNS